MSLPGITGMHGLVGAVASATPPGLSFGGVQGGQWDPATITTLWKDTAGTSPVTADGDLVARIDDTSGNGNHLLQATAGSRPVYRTSGGLYWLEFDGTKFLRLAFAGVGTTWTRVSGVQVNTPNLLRCIYGGAGAADNRTQEDASNGILMMPNGSTNGPALPYTINVDFVMTERWVNPGPSSIAKDNNAYVSTPSVNGVDPAGISVGIRADNINPIGMKWYGATMIGKTLTSGEIATLRTLYGAKQGRSL